MKFFSILFLTAMLAVIGVQIYRLNGQRSELTNNLAQLKQEAGDLKSDNSKLEGDIQYFQSDANLAKDLKAKFNYRRPDEKLIILVPVNASQ